MKKLLMRIVNVLCTILTVFFVLFGFSLIWCLRTWKHLKMDELIYELSAPLQGVGNDMLVQYALNCVVPALVFVLILIVLHFFIAKKTEKTGKIVKGVIFAASFCFALVWVLIFWNRLDVGSYLEGMGDDSTFIQDNYVDAGKVNMTFPEKKRNLIYIFLESVEMTYSDKENGGGFEFNCIPELTKLSEENENFSVDGKLNGGIVFPGTTWTMGAMFAQTSGLPLKIDIGENMMSTQETFFPGITTIGEVLKDAGYNQILALGSKIEFGGRKVYFEKHGEYTIHDYNYAIENGLIPEDYYVFWGFEDEKLFDMARNDLTELSKSDQPFNYTILTVDTHFEDGYVCHLCNDEFGDNQYANVMACSSRQVTEFVEWCKKQDFYENTTIVLCGDHTTMDADFCDDVSEDYLRKTYTAFINPAVEKVRKDTNISYSTMDMYPTTLAAMGVSIEGDQLGMGVNLFSDKETIVEKYGYDEVSRQLKLGSPFMNSLSGIDFNSDKLRSKQGWKPDADVNVTSYDPLTQILTLEVDDIVNVSNVRNVYATLYDNDGDKIKKYKLTMHPDRSYTAEIDISKTSSERGKIEVVAACDEGSVTLGTLNDNLGYQAHDNIMDYFELLKHKENIAVIIGMRREAIKRTPERVFNELKEMGITLDFEGKTGSSFYAIVDGDTVIQDIGKKELTYTGNFVQDGKEYTVESAAEDYGDECHIFVDDLDYARNKRGLNFVIYDYNRHAVVDSACFDVSPKKAAHPVCTTNAAIDGTKATITLSDLASAGEIKRDSARGEIWDAKNPEKVKEFEFTLEDDDTFTADIDVEDLDTSDCYIKIYIKNGKTLIEYLSCKWNGNLSELTDCRWDAK